MQPRTICDCRRNQVAFAANSTAEKSTRRVLLLTFVVMAIEIIGGSRLHSMALLADGWHMATHVAAFSITVIAYLFARRNADNDVFSFGVGKISVLGAFVSSIVLGGVALSMVYESICCLLHPLSIQFNDAICVACFGLIFNIASAFMLKDHHHGCHGYSNQNHHACCGHQHDLNLRAAYVHVIADAVTSLFAIVALLGGKFLGLSWLDPVMGLVGAAVVAQWACGLLSDTTTILLDKHPGNSNLHSEIRAAIEAQPGTTIIDLHIWQIDVNKFAAIISLVAPLPKTPAVYKEMLLKHKELVHITVEVHQQKGHEFAVGRLAPFLPFAFRPKETAQT